MPAAACALETAHANDDAAVEAATLHDAIALAHTVRWVGAPARHARPAQLTGSSGAH
ncbi:TPA: hypothetical protein SAY52_006279 [Burkholderia cenocepacia]|uniref:hypothetical protein n=1 Tax=unclassified Burkholderia TaxID=2613784 RepID=UPI00158C08ED|nr:MULTISPECIES: hypothetical protein [unclassified Burkholderia]HEF5875570.1 hypothetical protein [Burkholderia cenocepacia]